MSDRLPVRITGTIEFDDGETVDFGLGDDEDWRSGNRRAVLGDAVDVTEAIRDAVEWADPYNERGEE